MDDRALMIYFLSVTLGALLLLGVGLSDPTCGTGPGDHEEYVKFLGCSRNLDRGSEWLLHHLGVCLKC